MNLRTMIGVRVQYDLKKLTVIQENKMRLLMLISIFAFFSAPLVRAEVQWKEKNIVMSAKARELNMKILGEGDPEWPPVEELEPIRMGHGRAQVQRLTFEKVTDPDGSEWINLKTEEICVKEIAAPVFDTRGKDLWLIVIPTIHCSTEINNTQVRVNFGGYMMLEDASTPSGRQNAKAFASYAYTSEFEESPDIPEGAKLNKFPSAATLDLNATNMLFWANNVPLIACNGTALQALISAKSSSGTVRKVLEQENDNDCNYPDSGTQWIAVSFSVDDQG